jgi:hypothetical protein
MGFEVIGDRSSNPGHRYWRRQTLMQPTDS